MIVNYPRSALGLWELTRREGDAWPCLAGAVITPTAFLGRLEIEKPCEIMIPQFDEPKRGALPIGYGTGMKKYSRALGGRAWRKSRRNIVGATCLAMKR